MVFEVAVPEVTLAVSDVLTPLPVAFDVPAELETVAEWEVNDGLEAPVTGLVAVDLDAVGDFDVSWIRPPRRVSLSALYSCHRVRL